LLNDQAKSRAAFIVAKKDNRSMEVLYASTYFLVFLVGGIQIDV